MASFQNHFKIVCILLMCFYILIYHLFWRIYFCKTDFENDLSLKKFVSIFPQYNFGFTWVKIDFCLVAQKISEEFATLTKGEIHMKLMPPQPKLRQQHCLKTLCVCYKICLLIIKLPFINCYLVDFSLNMLPTTYRVGAAVFYTY